MMQQQRRRIISMKNHILRQWRETHNLSQPAAAKKIGVHRETWSRWENGTRMATRRHLKALMKLTGIASDKLVGL